MGAGKPALLTVVLYIPGTAAGDGGWEPERIFLLAAGFGRKCGMVIGWVPGKSPVPVVLGGLGALFLTVTSVRTGRHIGAAHESLGVIGPALTNQNNAMLPSSLTRSLQQDAADLDTCTDINGNTCAIWHLVSGS
ncbi:hypothetical protein BX600DRAFT_436836 [Xylariales sp. PMI_506]|nr:hypothetical protein BX600DRAFT_436836 [Xylariales sp. PMI_506]